MQLLKQPLHIMKSNNRHPQPLIILKAQESQSSMSSSTAPIKAQGAPSIKAGAPFACWTRQGGVQRCSAIGQVGAETPDQPLAYIRTLERLKACLAQEFGQFGKVAGHYGFTVVVLMVEELELSSVFHRAY